MTVPRSGLVARVKRLTNGAYRAKRRAGARGLAYAASSLIALAAFGVGASVRVAQASIAAPDTAELANRIGELTRREGELETELAAMSSSSTEQDAQASVRVLETQQELEHARAMQAWLEEKLIHE